MLSPETRGRFGDSPNSDPFHEVEIGAILTTLKKKTKVRIEGRFGLEKRGISRAIN